jgi:hypothetical protein
VQNVTISEDNRMKQKIGKGTLEENTVNKEELAMANEIRYLIGTICNRTKN